MPNNILSFLESLVLRKKRWDYRDVLGLYVTGENLYLSEVERNGKSFVLRRSVRIPLSVPLKIEVGGNTHFSSSLFRDPKFVGDLQRAVLTLKTSTRAVVVSLSHQFGIFRYFTMPDIPRQYWSQAIPLEAKKYIPFPMENLAYHFNTIHLTSMPDRKPYLGVLFCAAGAEPIGDLSQALQSVGLQCAAIELAPFSVARLLQVHNRNGEIRSLTQVHIDSHMAHILLLHLGFPVLSRDISLERETGFSERRQIDLTYTLEFARKQLGIQEMQRIWVTGSRDLSPWVSQFSQETALPVQVLETSKIWKIPEGSWDNLAAMGAALKTHFPDFPSPDLFRWGDVTEEQKNAVLGIWVFGIALSAFLLLLTPIQWMRCNLYQRKVDHYKSMTTRWPGLAGLEDQEVQKKINKLKLLTGFIEANTKRRVYLTRILQSLAERIPGSVWIESLDYQDLAPSQGISGGFISIPGYSSSFGGDSSRQVLKTLKISGYARFPTRTREIEAARAFRDALAGDPFFSRAFSHIGIAFPSAQYGVGPGKSSGTIFEVTCSQGAKVG